jgi:DNA-directed RNA polymerase specialized sigma24 family protein
VAKDEIILDPAIMEEILVHRDHYFVVPETKLDRVLDAVEALDEPHRSVVELIVWGKLSKSETGRQLGFSRQYVHKLWAESREVLKECLSEVLQDE